MQPSLAPEKCTATTESSTDTLDLSSCLPQNPITRSSACQIMPSTDVITRAKQECSPFLLPGPDEVVRRVWNCERDGQFVVKLFDIWQAENAAHYAFCVYEADTLKPIIRPRHPIQAAVLRLLIETELVPQTASIPFIVKTGKQVDRVTEIGGR